MAVPSVPLRKLALSRELLLVQTANENDCGPGGIRPRSSRIEEALNATPS
jgi:hypothetical protein